MLEQRIISTLKFFDLQDCPLTLLELHKFLLANIETVRQSLDEKFELNQPSPASPAVAVEAVLACLEGECAGEVMEYKGFYALAGRQELIQQRLNNYYYGFAREKLIKRFASGLRHLPFVRGVALAGSQALGLQKMGSDIDLLIITDQKFMGLVRLLVTCYFQILGLRRHSDKVANRFCLNHYIAVGKIIDQDKNLYSAAEYLKLRPLVYHEAVANFQKQNHGWTASLFPNASIESPSKDQPSRLQSLLERLLTNPFGLFLEKFSRMLQRRRITKSEFIVVSDDELSFHPNNRKQQLFKSFFQNA